MRLSRIVFTSLLMFVVCGSLAARAEEEHPCKEYMKHCKAQDLTPGHGLWKCVAQEAKKAGNEACMAKLKEGAMKMKAQKGHKEDAEKAAE